MNQKEIKEIKEVVSTFLDCYQKLMMIENFKRRDLDFEALGFKMQKISILLDLMSEENLILFEGYGFDLKKAIGDPMSELCALLIGGLYLEEEEA